MIRIRVPAQLRYRDVVVRTVAASCKLVGDRQDSLARQAPQKLDLGSEFDSDVVSAFSEVFNNVVLHGYAGHNGDVSVEIEASSVAIVIRVMDDGHAFDLESVPAPDLDTLPEGGMGVFICQQLLDELKYEPGAPNIWTLTKRFPPLAAGHGLTSQPSSE